MFVKDRLELKDRLMEGNRQIPSWAAEMSEFRPEGRETMSKFRLARLG